MRTLAILAKLPRWGRFAEALLLWHKPFQAELSKQGTILSWTKQAELPHVHDTDVPPATVQFAKMNSWKGQRVALMAHFDAQGIIADYVCYFAKKLAEQGYAVILCSAHEVKYTKAMDELPFAAIVYRTCTGYDFTSWKCALMAYPSLFQAKELLLTNDSILGPIGSLDPLYGVMDATPCDFWGIIESYAISPHLQSYYLVLRQETLEHKAFSDFWHIVGKSEVKMDSVNYETLFSGWLMSNGLQGAVRFPHSFFTETTLNPSHYAWDSLLKTEHFPFIKRELLTKNPYAVPINDLENLAKSKDYPYEYLQEHYRTKL